MGFENSVFFAGGRKFKGSLTGNDNSSFTIEKKKRGSTKDEYYEINIKVILSKEQVTNSVGDYEDLPINPATGKPDMTKMDNLVYIDGAYGTNKQPMAVELSNVNVILSAVPTGNAEDDEVPLRVEVCLDFAAGGKTNNGGLKTNNPGL